MQQLLIGYTQCISKGALCYAELGTVIKESGADYAYIHFAYGPVLSYTYSWVANVLVRPASMATITLTCAQYSMSLMYDDGCGDVPEIQKQLLAIFILRQSPIIDVCYRISISHPNKD